MTADPAEILLQGPWRHRFVAANGARFHVVEAGHGPLVLLLHGFPQFWWAWRHQIPALAEAGFRVAAMDLRGCGASDKPPSGYDTATLTADVAGVIRGLGANEAVVVGHDWGAWVAWAMPALEPGVTRGIGVLSMGHPLAMRAALLRPSQLGALAELLVGRLPWLAERRLRRGGVRRLVQRGWGEGRPDDEALERYQRVALLPSASHTILEYLRTTPTLAGRTAGRRSTRHLIRALAAPVPVPVLQMHGSRDPWVSERAAAVSRARVTGALSARMVPGAGHYLPEEAPTAVTAALLEWLTATALRPPELDVARADQPVRPDRRDRPDQA